MHVAVNMVGARHWYCVVLIMGHRLGVSWWRTPFTFILNDDRLQRYTLTCFSNQ